MSKSHLKTIFTGNSRENMNPPATHYFFYFIEVVMPGSFFHGTIITILVNLSIMFFYRQEAAEGLNNAKGQELTVRILHHRPTDTPAKLVTQ